jgi:predicted DNA-binding protein (MmcQ/YjbR family)
MKKILGTKTKPHAADEKALAKYALAFPESTEDFPWGHRAVKVKGKAFIFMALEEGALSLSVKLPRSSHFALMQDFASPTGYGLGKSGWVTASFGPKEKVPLDLMKEWIGESWRAIAPKKLLPRAP